MEEVRVPHSIPADKGLGREDFAALCARGQQRIYTGTARQTIGMPCGGIAAGQLYVLGDGTLGSWQIDGQNRFSGYGLENYRTYRPARPIEQGFAIAVTAPAGAAVGAELNSAPLGARATLDDDGYDAIEFVGEYPRALIRYRAKDRPVPPVEVDLEVFSPFIPLKAKESAWPATVLRFTVKNTGNQPVDVALGGWLENMVFAERGHFPITLRRQARAVQGPGVSSVLLDAVEARPQAPSAPATRIIADFESGTYEGWTVTGDAFGTAPATGALPNQSPVSGFGGKYFINSFDGGDDPTGKMVSAPFAMDLPYLTFRIGGGNYEGQTCLNLVVDGRVVRTATGRNSEALELRIWDVHEFAGRQAQLEIVDERKGPWGHVLIDDIVLTNTLPADYREYDEAALGFGNMALSVVGDGTAHSVWSGRDAFIQTLGQPRREAESNASPGQGRTVGSVTAKLTLAPGQSRDVTFLVSWYFPNLHTGHGRMYTNWFKDSVDVAQQLAKQLDQLRGEMVRFCDGYYRGTTLPW